MLFAFPCARCGTCIRLLPPKAANSAARCRRCGCVHCVTPRRETQAISPLLMGFDDSRAARVAPWMLPWERPLINGAYECKFSDAGVLPLRWTGRYFSWQSKRVDDRTLQTWRGAWGASDVD